MRYSQAILVACVGGASLASAMPAGEHHGTPVPKSRTQRYGNAIGKATVLAGTFAKAAAGNNYPVNDYSDTTFGALKKRGPRSRLGKTHVVHAARKGKELGKSAVTAAGGATTLAENVGSVFNLVKQNTQPSYPPLTGREPVSVSSREFEDDLEARMFDRLVGNYYNRKADALKKEAAKATAVAGVYSNSGAASAVYKREFLHELDARDVADYLEARGRFLHALGALKDTITGKTRVSSMPIADPYAPVARDLSEDVDARDFKLDSRDFDFEIDELD
ncbi:hypothetical protein FPV67DRAFT_1155930 [Lyophyllum atratum]|nr:hypothetical protein FPV67DRAFT_1155930 [Lyophyllum atratum]